jgi:uncharacterized protein YdaU (DUF1376 family)
MSKFPFMPLFLGDLLSDTLHLSSQEFGAYVLLFCHAWKHEAKVTVKDAQKIGRVGNRHWAAVKAKLAPFFEPSNGLLGGTLEVVHPRVVEELAKAVELSEKRKQAARQKIGLLGGALEGVPSRRSKRSAKGNEFNNENNGRAEQLQGKNRASASVLHAVCITHSHAHQKKNSSKGNSSSGCDEAKAPARSLTLEARARSPASEWNREPDPFGIDEEEYARRLNPPPNAKQITRLP